MMSSRPSRVIRYLSAAAALSASMAACGPESRAFYYDVPPGGPTPPRRILLCPATCAVLAGQSAPSIELQVNCD